MLGELPVADHDAGGVHTRVPVEALERATDLDDLADLWIEFTAHPQLARGLGDLQLALQLAGLVRVFFHGRANGLGIGHAQRERDLGALGHHLRQLVGLGGELLHDPTDVAQQAAGLEAVEGRDLADVFLAVEIADVLDDLLAPVHAKVDVEVGHGHPLRVQEALEQEVVLERIDVGDPHAVGHQAARTRAPAGAHGHTDLFGVTDEVPDDQEVARELHTDDDPQLALEASAVAIFIGFLAEQTQLDQSLVQALPGDIAQVGDLIRALGELEVGQFGLTELELHVAHRRDPRGVVHGLGVALEVAPHLLGGLDEKLGAVVLEALLVVDGPTHAHAHENVVGVGLGLVDVVAVVGPHQRHTEVLTQLGQVGVDPLLSLEAIGLELQVVGPGLEDIGVLADPVSGGVHVATGDQARDVAPEAGRQSDQSLAVFAQNLSIDTRVVIEALEVPVADQALEILVADLVLGQEDDVVIFAVGLGLGLTIGDVGLAAEDRLHTVGLGLLVELDGAEHVAVVGHRHRLHAPFLNLAAEVRHADGTVEQRVLGVQVQMCEVIHARGIACEVGRHWREPTPSGSRLGPA